MQKLLALLMGWSTPALCALSCYYRLDNDAHYAARFSPMHASVVTRARARVRVSRVRVRARVRVS